jgi:hypothetical protein
MALKGAETAQVGALPDHTWAWALPHAANGRQVTVSATDPASVPSSNTLPKGQTNHSGWRYRSYLALSRAGLPQWHVSGPARPCRSGCRGTEKTGWNVRYLTPRNRARWHALCHPLRQQRESNNPMVSRGLDGSGILSGPRSKPRQLCNPQEAPVCARYLRCRDECIAVLRVDDQNGLAAAAGNQLVSDRCSTEVDTTLWAIPPH